MKNLMTLLAVFFIGYTASADTGKDRSTTTFNYYNGESFIFTEGNVEFSVFPDGQFDFRYIGPQHGTQVSIGGPNVNISFNAGYDYAPYIQRDDYGAVIQIEDIPVYYDYYGRIIRAGNIVLDYNRYGLAQVGNLYINYNNYGRYVGTRGFINVYNRNYVYRPWHQYYVRPIFSNCIVFARPYRAYYNPVRFTYAVHYNYYRTGWYNTHYNTNYYRPGQKVRSYNRGQRLQRQRDLAPVRNRSNQSYARTNTRVSRSNREGLSNQNSRSRTDRTIISRTGNTRSNNAGRATTTRGNSNATRTRSNTSSRAVTPSTRTNSRVKTTTRTTTPRATRTTSRSSNNSARVKSNTSRSSNAVKSNRTSRSSTTARSSSNSRVKASSSRGSSNNRTSTTTSRRRGN
jgi:hypothetical protein